MDRQTRSRCSDEECGYAAVVIMKISAMNCPNCGAGIAGDSSRCEFCKTRLKSRACSHCFSLMFVGTKHCANCGKKLVETAEGETVIGNCPRCRFRLEPLLIGDAKLSECLECNGVWMTADSFEELCTDHDVQTAILGYKGRDRSSVVKEASKVSYLPCPVCRELMNRSNFARASGVIIDTCKSHGVWFDADELPRIIEFIRSGGMSLARQRELRDIETEREKLRDEKRSSRIMARRFGPDRTNSEDETGVKGFLRRLFE